MFSKDKNLIVYFCYLLFLVNGGKQREKEGGDRETRGERKMQGMLYFKPQIFFWKCSLLQGSNPQFLWQILQILGIQSLVFAPGFKSNQKNKLIVHARKKRKGSGSQLLTKFILESMCVIHWICKSYQSHWSWLFWNVAAGMVMVVDWGFGMVLDEEAFMVGEKGRNN